MVGCVVDLLPPHHLHCFLLNPNIIAIGLPRHHGIDCFHERKWPIKTKIICRLIIKKIAASCYVKANVTQLSMETGLLSLEIIDSVANDCLKHASTLTVSHLKIRRIGFFALRQMWPPSTIWCLYRGTQNNWGIAPKSISDYMWKKKALEKQRNENEHRNVLFELNIVSVLHCSRFSL